jgi:putative inorganic carbon (HCO3(-)) transporter
VNGALRQTSLLVAAAITGGLAIAVAVSQLGASIDLGLAAIAGGAIVLASVQRLDVGLFFLVALTYSQAFVVLQTQTDLPSFALPFVVAVLAAAFFARDPDEAFLPRTAEPALAVFGAYAAWLLASAAWAKNPDVTLTAVGAHAKRMLVVLAILALVRSPRALVVALWSVVCAAAALAGLTVVQHFWEAQTFFGFAKPLVPELTETGEVLRAVGPVGNPNAYAQMLVVAVPFALGRLFVERRVGLRALALAAAALCCAAVLLTFSRGGFVGLAVVLMLAFFRLRPRLAAMVLVAGVILVVAGGLSNTYSSRVGTLTQLLPWHSDPESGDLSIRSRQVFLDVSARMWRDHPLVGVGHANYADSYHEYNRNVGMDPDQGHSAHNTPLEVIVETGVIGLVLWVLLAVAAAASLWRVRTWVGRSRQDVWLTIDFLAISVAGYLVTSLFLSPAFPVLYWLLLAICFSVAGAIGAGVRPVRERLRVPLPARAAP